MLQGSLPSQYKAIAIKEQVELFTLTTLDEIVASPYTKDSWKFDNIYL